MRFTRVKSPVPDERWQGALMTATSGFGFYGNVRHDPFEFRNIRVDPATRGYNVHARTGKRTRSLSWADWVEFNAVVNEVLDHFRVSANVSTLGGKFVIRRGKKAYTEDDWRDLKYENVGSMMQPMSREESIVHE